MSDKSRRIFGINIQFGPLWMFFAVVFGIVILSLLAFTRPVYQVGTETSPPADPSATAEAESINQDGLEPTATEDLPPRPEEIGYTDGIIFLSTLLVLILIIGTLREIYYRKRQQQERPNSKGKNEE